MNCSETPQTTWRQWMWPGCAETRNPKRMKEMKPRPDVRRSGWGAIQSIRFLAKKTPAEISADVQCSIQTYLLIVTPLGHGIKCHYNQITLYCVTVSRHILLPIWTLEKCHCNQMVLHCVTVTSVTVSEEVCNNTRPGSYLGKRHCWVNIAK